MISEGCNYFKSLKKKNNIISIYKKMYIFLVFYIETLRVQIISNVFYILQKSNDKWDK